MFSRRSNWDLSPNRLASALDQARKDGAPLLDLTETNPTRAGFHYPAGLLAGLGRAEALAYDPDPRGARDVREAVAAQYAAAGTPVDPERVLLTASTSEAYALLFKLLCDPGDRVLVPQPSYPLFGFLAGLESVETDAYSLAYDGHWHLDLARLEDEVRPATRAIVVVNPNNPTGSYLKQDEWSRLQPLAARRGLAVIADEVFYDYPLQDDAQRAPGAAAAREALSFALGGLSKSCGLPQVKLGWVVVAGPDDLARRALARLEVIADTYLSVGTPVQRAARGLLAAGEAVRAQIAQRVAANHRTLAEAVAGTPATLLRVEGGWSAVLQVPATHSEDEWALRLLHEDHVVVHPGYFFDFPREAFLVLSLLAPADVFRAGVLRLRGRLLHHHGERP